MLVLFIRLGVPLSRRVFCWPNTCLLVERRIVNPALASVLSRRMDCIIGVCSCGADLSLQEPSFNLPYASYAGLLAGHCSVAVYAFTRIAPEFRASNAVERLFWPF